MITKFIKDTYLWFEKKLKNDHLDSYAAQSAFFLIISILPFSVFFLSILNLININGETVISYALNLFPNEIGDFLKTFILVEYQPITILSVSGFAVLWSASKAAYAIVKGLNSVYAIDETRNYLHVRFLAIFYTIAFAIILVATIVILLFGNSLYTFIINRIAPDFTSVVFDDKYLWAFIILTIFFCASYNLVPRKVNIKFKYSAISALIASSSWMLFSFGFSFFIENFANYSNMYGGLATVVIFMLWLYFCMYIMLFSAEISVWLQEKFETK
ncbi:MAG: YihY/virulence factor BrkB family protein [Clostridia bacterium]